MGTFMNIDKKNDNTNELEMDDMIGLFKKIADNPISKGLLQRTLKYCDKDKALKLESSLKYYLDKSQDACYSCKTMSKIVGYIIQNGAKSFGVSEDELKEIMEDDYWIRGLTSVLKGIGLFGVNKPFVPGAPFQIVWNITKACNMRCIHCYECASVRSNDELSKDQIIRGIDNMAKAGVASIAFSGGEPSIHPDILEFIKRVEDNGMCAAMATNGYTLKDKYKANKFVNAGLEFVQISLDGINPKTHDSFRKIDGSWEKAIEAIKNFVDLGIFVEVATTVTEHNINEIPEMVDFLRDLGIDWFMLYNFIPTGNGSEFLELDISPKKRKELLENAYHENSDDMQILSTAPQYAAVAELMLGNDQDNENEMIPTHFYNPQYTNPMIAQLADFIGGCGAGRFYMNIEPNGDIYPCVFFPHDEEVKVGNLMDNDFEELWKNDLILNQLRNKEILKSHCGECDSRNICGGCRARAYNYFGDILAPDPGCINNQNEWDFLKNEITKKHGEAIINESEDYDANFESLVLNMNNLKDNDNYDK